MRRYVLADFVDLTPMVVGEIVSDDPFVAPQPMDSLPVPAFSTDIATLDNDLQQRKESSSNIVTAGEAMLRYPFARYQAERDMFIRRLNDNPSLNEQLNDIITANLRETDGGRQAIVQFVAQHATLVNIDPLDAQAKRAFAESYASEIVGLGGLDDLIADENIVNITVNASAKDDSFLVVCDTIDGKRQTINMPIARNFQYFKETVLNRNALRLSGSSSREFTDKNPVLMLVTQDTGARITALLTPTFPREIYVSVRMNRVGSPTLDDLFDSGVIVDKTMRDFLYVLGQGNLNVLIVGPQQSGKTTLLRGLINVVPQEVPIMLIEDGAELKIKGNGLHDVVIEVETAPDLPNMSMRQLIKTAMRYKVDRVYVGEALDSAISNWLLISQRLRGGATTIHAESPDQALDAVLSLLTINPEPNTIIDRQIVMKTISASVDFIMFMRHVRNPLRNDRPMPMLTDIRAVSHVLAANGDPQIHELWKFDPRERLPKWQKGASLPELVAERLRNIGVRLSEDDDGQPVVEVIDPNLAGPRINKVLHPTYDEVRKIERERRAQGMGV